MTGQTLPACSIHGTQDWLGTADVLSGPAGLVALASCTPAGLVALASCTPAGLVGLACCSGALLAPPPNKTTINKMSPNGPASTTSATVLFGVTG
jgi:hypothetical protein